MHTDFDSILEQCLSQMASGKARAESCLLSYPALADELAPLLQAAEQLSSLPQPVLSPEAKARIEARVLGAVKVSPRARLNLWLRSQSHPRRRPVFVAVAAALVVLFFFTAILSTASGVLPDSPLYRIKRAEERIWLWLAPVRDEPQLYLRFAHRRLDELMALASKGSFDPALVYAMGSDVEAAITSLEGLAPAIAAPVLEGILGLALEQQEELASLLSSVPSTDRHYLEEAMATSGRQAARAEEILGSLQPVQPPGLTKTPQPPGLTKTPQPPGHTKTPQPPGHTKTPQPPGLTKTPQPPGLTKTPQPPGQAKTPQPPKPTKTPKPPKATKTPKTN